MREQLTALVTQNHGSIDLKQTIEHAMWRKEFFKNLAIGLWTSSVPSFRFFKSSNMIKVTRVN
jgi:hypothetical protein